MLSMQNISMVYRTDTVETHALREFSLEVGEGEFVAVTGPSGSGKTTFLNIAGLLEKFTAGKYVLDGKDVSIVDEVRRDVSFVELHPVDVLHVGRSRLAFFDGDDAVFTNSLKGVGQ